MTSSPTSPSVTATTATKARVSRPCSVRGVRLSALGERVPDTANGLDEGGMRRVVLELVPQVADVDVDRLLVLVERVVVAEEIEQLRPRVDATGLAREVAEDLELRRRQADPALTALDPPPVEVDQQVAMPDHAPADGVGQVSVGPAEERLDPAEELAQPERRRQVIVRPELEADDLVDLFVAGREHQHR